LLPLLPYNLTSPERENTVGLVATFLQCLNPIIYNYLPILQYHNSRHALLGKTLGNTLLELKKQQLGYWPATSNYLFLAEEKKEETPPQFKTRPT
jgi:hypothetical protein